MSGSPHGHKDEIGERLAHSPAEEIWAFVIEYARAGVRDVRLQSVEELLSSWLDSDCLGPRGAPFVARARLCAECHFHRLLALLSVRVCRLVWADGVEFERVHLLKVCLL